jgi:hypothetical protein
MMTTPRLMLITITGTLAYLGLAILGWGGFPPVRSLLPQNQTLGGSGFLMGDLPNHVLPRSGCRPDDAVDPLPQRKADPLRH